MGREDVVLNRFYEDAERFADLFNGILFRGEKVIKPEELRDGSESYRDVVTEAEDKKYSARFRDIKKYLESGLTLRVLAVENQTLVDYTMPWRCMDYDSREYGKQLKQQRGKNRSKRNVLSEAEWLCGFQKEDRLNPTFTICIYHGEEKWDGPRSLKEMMNFGEDGDCWERWFADYPLHLICINELEDLECFHSPLREFFAALQCRHDSSKLEKLITSDESYTHLDEDTMEAMVVMMKNKRLLENRQNYRDEGGRYNMCKALDDLTRQSEMKGKREGKIEGVIVTLLEMGIDVATISAKLQSRFEISVSEAEEYIHRFLVEC